MWSLGFTNNLGVSSVGQGGGLVLFWKVPFSVELLGYNSSCIDVVITAESGKKWRTSFVYGEPRREKRHEFWNFMRDLKTQWDGPWICCGDFNEALSQDEHYGSCDRSEAQVLLFKECLDDCSLVDLGFIGPKFTWSNKQDGDRNVRVRLDRAVVNAAFSQLFDDCRVENVITTTSDHYALAVSFANFCEEQVNRPIAVGFRYEAAWQQAPDYKMVTKRAWADNSDGPPSLRSTWATLNGVAVSLGQWSRDSFGKVRRQIQKLERHLKYLRLAPWGHSLDESQAVERELCELFEREEVMARQRSRVEWLKEGDRNTPFFHARMSAHR
jgi:hypothetical protein